MTRMRERERERERERRGEERREDSSPRHGGMFVNRWTSQYSKYFLKKMKRKEIKSLSLFFFFLLFFFFSKKFVLEFLRRIYRTKVAQPNDRYIFISKELKVG